MFIGVEMKKVMAVFGTRPEAIKMCPVIYELKKRKRIESIVCVTGQHREMLDMVLNVFGIVPDYDLDIMKKEQTLFEITQRILLEIAPVLEKERPDIVLVHGDTTTSFAAALASFYLGLKVGHIEAGLRTYDLQAPFPEEFNRQAVGLIASLHFAPTEQAKCNLLKENKNIGNIFVTGNTAIDAIKLTIKKEYASPILDWADGSKLLLMTVHRRENIGKKMRHIFGAIKRIIDEFDGIKVLYPVHLNPQVRKCADEIFENSDKIKLVEPLDVVDFHNIMARSYLIITDSGGIQEEAPALHKPVLVVRDMTERMEGIQAGTLVLAGTEEERVYLSIKWLLSDLNKYRQMEQAHNPYGDGNASVRIVDIIEQKI